MLVGRDEGEQEEDIEEGEKEEEEMVVMVQEGGEEMESGAITQQLERLSTAVEAMTAAFQHQQQLHQQQLGHQNETFHQLVE